jgi:ESS family glutamate:Na+ symporter
VDPENKTPALSAFSYKQLLHEPIVGGGIWTALVLPFIANIGIWLVESLSDARLVVAAVVLCVVLSLASCMQLVRSTERRTTHN